MELFHVIDGRIRDPRPGDIAKAVRNYKKIWRGLGPEIERWDCPTIPYVALGNDDAFIGVAGIYLDQAALWSGNIPDFFTLFFLPSAGVSQDFRYKLTADCTDCHWLAMLDDAKINDCIQALTDYLAGNRHWIEDYPWVPEIQVPEVVDESVTHPTTDSFKSGNREGVIYLLRSGTWYKIGKTVDPKSRYGQLDIQLPEKAEKMHEISTSNIDTLERHWHKYFKDKRANGEWFQLTDEDVREFMSYNRVDIK